MATNVSYLWDFGDGTSSGAARRVLPKTRGPSGTFNVSNEQNPIHIYEMPGVYEVTLTVTDSSGNVYTGTLTITVYDYSYGDENGPPSPLPSLTNTCYRLPVRPGDGFGPSEYKDSDNPGRDWIWPPSEKGTAIGHTEDQQEVALVLDAKTQKIYKINDETVWEDRVGKGYSEGKRIISECHQKAYVANAGEHIAIEHNETHSYFKPFKKENKGAAGFGENGLPLQFQVDMQMHKNGEQVYEKKTTDIPVDGDIVFQEKLEARELQLRVKMYNAPWLLTGIQNEFETIDKASRPSLRQMTETEYQSSLSSLPLFHISRNFFPLRNRATGENATGTIANLVTGPDERELSGVNFSAGNGISDTLPENLAGDFTLMGWFNNMPTIPVGIWNIGTFAVSIEAGYILEIDDGINPVINVALSYNGLKWAHITIVRSGLEIKVYENKILLGVFNLNTIEDYGVSCSCISIAQGSGFDVIVLPRSLDSEIGYYYDNVLRGGGEVLPDF